MGNCSTICGTFEPTNNHEILKKINNIEEINNNPKASPDFHLNLPKNTLPDESEKENNPKKTSERKFKEYQEHNEFQYISQTFMKEQNSILKDTTANTLNQKTQFKRNYF